MDYRVCLSTALLSDCAQHLIITYSHIKVLYHTILFHQHILSTASGVLTSTSGLINTTLTTAIEQGSTKIPLPPQKVELPPLSGLTAQSFLQDAANDIKLTSVLEKGGMTHYTMLSLLSLSHTLFLS